MDTKLIMIEGIIGSGKSTTAEYLARTIRRHDKNTVWYHENTPEHPLNTAFSRLLQENYGKTFDITQSIMKMRTYNDEVNTLPLWKTFSNRVAKESTITVIESRFWQHEATYWFLSGYEPEAVLAHQAEIQASLSIIQPVLVYLANDDVKSVIEKAFATRPEKWRRWAIWLFGELPYLKMRKLEGIQGIIEFYEAWNILARELYDCYPYPKIEIRNPQQNWKSAYEKLLYGLGLKDVFLE